MVLIMDFIPDCSIKGIKGISYIRFPTLLGWHLNDSLSSLNAKGGF